MQCFDLLTGYSAELRIKVNRRWEELENSQLPQTYLEALKVLVIETEKNQGLQIENSDLKIKLDENAQWYSVKKVQIMAMSKLIIKIYGKQFTDWNYKGDKMSGKKDKHFRRLTEKKVKERYKSIVDDAHKKFIADILAMPKKDRRLLARLIRKGIDPYEWYRKKMEGEI